MMTINSLKNITKNLLFIDGATFFLSLLLAVFIPFWNLGVSITIILLFFCFLYEIKNKKKYFFVPTKMVLIFVLFYVYKTVVSVLNGRFIEDFKSLKTLLPFLIIGFILPNLNEIQKRAIKFVFAGCFFCFQIFVFFRIIPFLIEYNSFTLLNGNEINNSLIIERPYLGFFSLLSLILIFSENKGNKTRYLLSFFYIFFTFFFLFLISARMSLISLFVFLIWIFYVKVKINKWFKISTILPIAGLLLFLFSTPSILGKRFKQIKSDPRVVIWNAGLNILNESKSIILGLKGDQLVEDKLLEQYKNIKDKEMREWYLRSKFNTHNQYLHELLSYGFLSLFILLTIVFKILYMNGISNYGFIMAVMFLLFLVVENLFHRQMGVTAFVFFNLLFLKNENE